MSSLSGSFLEPIRKTSLVCLLENVFPVASSFTVAEAEYKGVGHREIHLANPGGEDKGPVESRTYSYEEVSIYSGKSLNHNFGAQYQS